MKSPYSNAVALILFEKARKTQSGVALFFAIFALLVLSALAAALVLVASTETTINSNYRSEEVAFFAAKAGIEEVMDRMMTNTTQTPAITPPAALPGSAGSVIYLINPGSASASTIQPWSSSNAYADDEFCHDYSVISSLNLQAAPPDVPCTGSTSLPGGTSWYTSVTSNAPWNGTAAALPYVWARVAWKLNGSETYLGGGTTPTVSTYAVNSTLSSASPVCWNGVSEVVLPSGYSSCSAWSAGVTPVYLATSLAITSTGTRKMVQADIAQTPIPTMVYGLFASSSTCGAISMTGNSSTDSYSSTVGAYGGTNKGNNGGIGSNGNINLTGNVAINGLIGVQNSTTTPLTGNCAAPNFATGPDVTTTGNVTCVDGQSCGTTNPVPPNPKPIQCLQSSPGVCSTSPTLAMAAPPAPNPLPPTTNTNYTGNTSASLVPGSYGNLSFTGNTTLTLAPGVYNINSLSMTGNNSVSISPTGQVILNIAGQNTSSPLTLTGNANTNASSIPANLLINYAGTGTITVTGNGQIYGVIDAPNAPIQFTGNGNIYGAAIGSAISFTGNAAFHFDTSVQQPNSSPSTYYSRIAYRELPY